MGMPVDNHFTPEFVPIVQSFKVQIVGSNLRELRPLNFFHTVGLSMNKPNPSAVIYLDGSLGFFEIEIIVATNSQGQ